MFFTEKILETLLLVVLLSLSENDYTSDSSDTAVVSTTARNGGVLGDLIVEAPQCSLSQQKSSVTESFDFGENFDYYNNSTSLQCLPNLKRVQPLAVVYNISENSKDGKDFNPTLKPKSEWLFRETSTTQNRRFSFLKGRIAITEKIKYLLEINTYQKALLLLVFLLCFTWKYRIFLLSRLNTIIRVHSKRTVPRSVVVEKIQLTSSEKDLGLSSIASEETSLAENGDKLPERSRVNHGKTGSFKNDLTSSSVESDSQSGDSSVDDFPDGEDWEPIDLAQYDSESRGVGKNGSTNFLKVKDWELPVEDDIKSAVTSPNDQHDKITPDQVTNVVQINDTTLTSSCSVQQGTSSHTFEDNTTDLLKLKDLKDDGDSRIAPPGDQDRKITGYKNSVQDNLSEDGDEGTNPEGANGANPCSSSGDSSIAPPGDQDDQITGCKDSVQDDRSQDGEDIASDEVTKPEGANGANPCSSSGNNSIAPPGDQDDQITGYKDSVQDDRSQDGEDIASDEVTKPEGANGANPCSSSGDSSIAPPGDQDDQITGYKDSVHDDRSQDGEDIASDEVTKPEGANGENPCSSSGDSSIAPPGDQDDQITGYKDSVHDDRSQDGEDIASDQVTKPEGANGENPISSSDDNSISPPGDQDDQITGYKDSVQDDRSQDGEYIASDEVTKPEGANGENPISSSGDSSISPPGDQDDQITGYKDSVHDDRSQDGEDIASDEVTKPEGANGENPCSSSGDSSIAPPGDQDDQITGYKDSVHDDRSQDGEDIASDEVTKPEGANGENPCSSSGDSSIAPPGDQDDQITGYKDSVQDDPSEDGEDIASDQVTKPEGANGENPSSSSDDNSTAPPGDQDDQITGYKDSVHDDRSQDGEDIASDEVTKPEGANGENPSSSSDDNSIAPPGDQHHQITGYKDSVQDDRSEDGEDIASDQVTNPDELTIHTEFVVQVDEDVNGENPSSSSLHCEKSSTNLAQMRNWKMDNLSGDNLMSLTCVASRSTNIPSGDLSLNDLSDDICIDGCPNTMTNDIEKVVLMGNLQVDDHIDRFETCDEDDEFSDEFFLFCDPDDKTKKFISTKDLHPDDIVSYDEDDDEFPDEFFLFANPDDKTKLFIATKDLHPEDLVSCDDAMDSPYVDVMSLGNQSDIASLSSANQSFDQEVSSEDITQDDPGKEVMNSVNVTLLFLAVAFVLPCLFLRNT